MLFVEKNNGFQPKIYYQNLEPKVTSELITLHRCTHTWETHQISRLDGSRVDAGVCVPCRQFVKNEYIKEILLDSIGQGTFTVRAYAGGYVDEESIAMVYDLNFATNKRCVECDMFQHRWQEIKDSGRTYKAL